MSGSYSRTELIINISVQEWMTDLVYKNRKKYLYNFHITSSSSSSQSHRPNQQSHRHDDDILLSFFSVVLMFSCSIYLYLCIIKSVIMCISFSLFYGCHYDARPSRHELVQRIFKKDLLLQLCIIFLRELLPHWWWCADLLDMYEKKLNEFRWKKQKYTTGLFFLLQSYLVFL